MSVFKTTFEIKDNPWQDYENNLTIPNIVPEKIEWHGLRELRIEDVEVWEQIFYQPGNIGIYASYNPYGELYIITYNLYIDTEFGIESFYGPNAAARVKERAKDLGIELPITKIWIDDINDWMYDDSRLAPFK